MPAKTNSQHPDRVIRQTEKIAAEIEPMLMLFAKYVMDRHDAHKVIDVDETVEKLATYVIDYRRNDWYDGFGQGYQAARDGKEMADKEAYEQLPENHGARG